MISLRQAEQVHQVLTDNFGGAQGIRDQQGLLSALARILSSFQKNK